MTDNDKAKKSNSAPRRRNRRGGKRKNTNNTTPEAVASSSPAPQAPTSSSKPPAKGGGSRNNRRRGNNKDNRRPVQQEPTSPTPQFVEYVTGELFDNVVEASLIVVEANAEGVANTQMVIQLRNKYPEFFAEYLAGCEAGTYQAGDVLFTQARDGRHLGLVCTYKDKYLGLVDTTTIGGAFNTLREYIDTNALETIAMPPIGGGIGLLNWPRIRRYINQSFKTWNGKIFVYVKADKVERTN